MSGLNEHHVVGVPDAIDLAVARCDAREVPGYVEQFARTHGLPIRDALALLRPAAISLDVVFMRDGR